MRRPNQPLRTCASSLTRTHPPRGTPPSPQRWMLNPLGWEQPGSPRTRYLGMYRRILTRDTGAAIGLITGIILGSLLLNLTGSY